MHHPFAEACDYRHLPAAGRGEAWIGEGDDLPHEMRCEADCPVRLSVPTWRRVVDAGDHGRRENSKSSMRAWQRSASWAPANLLSHNCRSPYTTSSNCWRRSPCTLELSSSARFSSTAIFDR